MKLVRQLQPARRHCIAAAAQWTGVGAWIAAGLFVIFVLPGRVIRTFGESKRDVAKITLHELAYEAYPRWLEAHPGEHCPADIKELSPNLHDPWGQSYTMTCCPASGPLIVTSPGEDGRYGTPDDLRSDD